MAKMKELEDENRRLKKMYADAQMRALIVEEAFAKNRSAISAAGDGQGSGCAARCWHRPGMHGISYQSDLLSLPEDATRRERRDRQLVGASDR